MGIFTRLIAKIILNGAALWVAKTYFSGFILTDGITTLAVGAVVLALLNLFLRPILRLVATPLIWITFGLFNIIIHIFILWLADMFLVSLSITDFITLFWVSLIVAIINSFA